MLQSTTTRTISPTLLGERRASPPRTPPLIAIDVSKNPRQSSTPPSDESSIIELSFDYELDSAGNYVRVSKGSSRSNNSSPPTPHEALLDSLPNKPSPPVPPYTYMKPPSPILLHSPALRRNSLSQAETAHVSQPQSAPLDQPQHRSSGGSLRSFHRVASGPAAVTPAAQTNLRVPGSRGTGHKLTRPQRIPLDEYRDYQHVEEREDNPRVRGEWDLRNQEEKENIITSFDAIDGSSSDAVKRISPRLAGRSASLNQVDGRAAPIAPSRSYGTVLSGPIPASRAPLQSSRSILPGPSRAGRVLMATKYRVGPGGFGKITENEGSESEAGGEYAGEDTDPASDEPQILGGIARHRSYTPGLTQSGNARPRRSASLSDASATEERPSPRAQPILPTSQSQYASRPGSSLGLNQARTRRTTIDQDDPLLEYALRQAADNVNELPSQQTHQTPSPTHVSQAVHLRVQTHRRRDSDTVRTPATDVLSVPSPTAVEHPPGLLSPQTRLILSQQHSMASLQVQPTPVPQGQVYHRRSPTAPEPPTTSGTLAPPQGTSAQQSGKTWAAGDEPIESESEAKGVYMVKTRPPPPPPSSGTTSTAPSAPVPVRNHNICVNKKVYARLDLIGKGGSSRVYRVMNAANEIFAIKRVSLDKTDAETMKGYMNEIGLLKRLEGNNRIIQLFDSEVKAGPGGTKGYLMLVMECGEIDLAKLLQEQQKEPLNMVWVSYYWQQMLQAVHVIHEEKIVHSDLKPANFVLVRGQLKLIDFGIANAIANDTTNIQRDHQIGTVNYMSPEAIELPDGMRRLKVGRPSDVWSLGCILYQMVYGQPPFQHLSVYQKMKAIPDLAYVIEFPDHSIPSVVSKSGERKKLEHLKRPVRADIIRGMRSCLARNPKERATIPQLLEQEWLALREPENPAPKPTLARDETVINPYYMKQLLEYGIKLGRQAQSGDIDQDYLAKEAERLVQELKALES